MTNGGSTLSKLVCAGLSYDGGVTNITTGEGVTITAGATAYNLNGTSTQTFTIAVAENTDASQRVFTFKAENLLNRDAFLAFSVTQPGAGS